MGLLPMVAVLHKLLAALSSKEKLGLVENRLPVVGTPALSDLLFMMHNMSETKQGPPPVRSFMLAGMLTALVQLDNVAKFAFLKYKLNVLLVDSVATIEPRAVKLALLVLKEVYTLFH